MPPTRLESLRSIATSSASSFCVAVSAVSRSGAPIETWRMLPPLNSLRRVGVGGGGERGGGSSAVALVVEVQEVAVQVVAVEAAEAVEAVTMAALPPRRPPPPQWP